MFLLFCRLCMLSFSNAAYSNQLTRDISHKTSEADGGRLANAYNEKRAKALIKTEKLLYVWIFYHSVKWDKH